MVGWHHWLDGHECNQAVGVHDGQGSLVCCTPWGHKESDTTERLNWTELFLSTYHLKIMESKPMADDAICLQYMTGWIGDLEYTGLGLYYRLTPCQQYQCHYLNFPFSPCKGRLMMFVIPSWVCSISVSWIYILSIKLVMKPHKYLLRKPTKE